MTASKRIVVLNGPIFCGKDTLADYLVSTTSGATKMEMKTKLIELTRAIHSVSEKWWNDNYTREGKELPRVELGGMSMRQALIHTSEVVIKSNYGKDYFGKASRKLLNEIADTVNEDGIHNQWFYYADGGFIEELIPLGEGLNPLLIRIHREGCNYDPATDSRNYISDEELPVNWTAIDIDNREGQFDEFLGEVGYRITKHFRPELFR